MSSATVAVDARCPLCGVGLPSFGGRLGMEGLHSVPLSPSGHGLGEGYLLCEECAVLAELPGDATPE